MTKKQTKVSKTLSLAELKKGTPAVRKRVKQDAVNALRKTQDNARLDIERNGTDEWACVLDAMQEKQVKQMQYRAEYQGLLEANGNTKAEAKAQTQEHMEEAFSSAPAMVDAWEDFQKATDHVDWNVSKACQVLVTAQRQVDGQGTTNLEAINSVRIAFNVPFRVEVDALVNKDRPGMKLNGEVYDRS